jgi:hypothetical protein
MSACGRKGAPEGLAALNATFRFGASGQAFKRDRVAGDESRFFRSSPPFQLLLSYPRGDRRRMDFMKDQPNWEPLACKRPATPIVMSVDAEVNVGCSPDVERAVGALEDINEVRHGGLASALRLAPAGLAQGTIRLAALMRPAMSEPHEVH